MENELKIITFDALTAGDGLWKAYFDHADEIHAEVDPEDPPLPREKRRALLISTQNVPYMNKYQYLLLTGDGEAAGYASASAENAKSPSYQSNKHMGRLNISVLSEYRRKGHGTRLLTHLTRELAVKEPAVTEFLAPVVLASGRSFFDRLGEERNRADGVEHTTIYTRERGGRVSGLTETAYLKEAGHKVTQMLTGVKADCRGRGLGKLLKALMLLDIRERHPDVKYVVTGNADSNAPMVGINTKLGFKKRLPLLLYKLKIKP